MRTWVIETEGRAHERYHIAADTEDEARAAFERGDLTDPVTSEVTDVEIISVGPAT